MALESALVDLLEEAPIIALLIDGRYRVLDANREARDFFQIERSRLPMTVLDATREVNLEDFLESRDNEGDVWLSHSRRTMACRTATGSRDGQRVVFLTDATELKRLMLVRQEFVSNLSHELKTPVTSLRAAAESILGDPPPEIRRRFANRVVREADYLTAIVDNLRQLSEIESGRAQVNRTQFNIRELAEEVVARFAPDRRVEVDIHPDLWLNADRAKIAQALGNLVDNAMKFSPSESAIEVRARETDGSVVITVRDHGPGISPEHWDRVFERFYKVDPARTRDIPGTGLGLALTKHLIRLHNGHVWTEAASDGGQVFGLALPREAA